MIAVSRKGWGNRSVLGSEMEEAEIEEGEAFNYHKGNGDSAVDPDINAFSTYIEEKLQNVLGHFQKDFEGGVSAENLGAKFGGYGSFLPTYQRSPEVVQNSQKSPKKEPKSNSVASANAQTFVRPSTASGKTTSTGHASKGRGKLQSGHAKKLSKKSGINEKPLKNLKLRIKVGSENLLAQKNVDIYNGLGLVSPSSSLDGSPAATELQHPKVIEMPDESPNSILQIMTAFPVDVLLSPLSEDLIHLNKRQRGKHESQTTAKLRTSTEKLSVINNGFHLRSNGNVPEAKRLKFSAPVADGDDRTVLPMKKDYWTGDDAVVAEDIISDALKLPLLSSREFGSTEHSKEMPTATSTHANILRDGKSRESLPSSTPAHETERVGNSGSSLGLSCNISEYGKYKSSSTNAAGPVIDNQTPPLLHPLDQSDSSASRVKKSRSAVEPSDVSKQLFFNNGVSARAENLNPSLEPSPNGIKKRQKAVQAVASQGAYTGNDESADELSMPLKHEKFSDAHFSDAKNDLGDPKKEIQKSNGRYKEFFGDEEFDDDDDDDDNDSHFGKQASAVRLKDSLSVKSNFNKDHSMPKDRSTSKISVNLQSKEKYPRMAPSHPSNPGHGTDAPTVLQPMVNEDWVQCDLCRLWRLLPLGADPKDLPDKWTCSMLDWLPGMNRCSIPEDDTTYALRALYQPAAAVPNPVSEGKQMGTSVGYIDQEHESMIMKTATINGKKRNGSTKATTSTNLDGSARSSSSKKVILTTGMGNNLSGADSSPSTDAGRHSGRSGAEKSGKSKRKWSIDSCSERGAQLSVKSRQEASVEGDRGVRTEELHIDDRRLIANDAGSPSRGNASLYYPNNTSENELSKSRSHLDFSPAGMKNLVSHGHMEATENNASVHSGKQDEKDTRKRKSREYRASETHSEKRSRASKSTKSSSMEAGWKSDGIKHELHGVYADNNQVPDYLKNDLGPGQLLLAANSSSSKVSDSRKNRVESQEVKGSPVESVSSSPLRYRDADKVSSAVKNIVKKLNIEDCRSLAAVSPRRLSSDGASNVQAETKRKNEHLCQNGLRPSTKNSSDQHYADGKSDARQSQDTEFQLKKSGRHSKTISLSSGHDLEKSGIRHFDSLDNRQSYEEKSKSYRNKHDDKDGTTSNGEKFISHKEAVGGAPNENGKAQSLRRSNDGGQDAIKSLVKRHDIQGYDNEKVLQKSNFNEGSGNGKSHSLPPLARFSADTAANHEPVPGSQKDNHVNVSTASASDNGNIQKIQSRKMKSENSNCPPVRLSTPNSHKGREVDSSSPVRKESSTHAANISLKEAADLKHTADRMKSAGNSEGDDLYFQSCLKFLHGASLLEASGSEANKNQSMHIYSTTAKLCEFCAHEYEKSEDMAAAALAYKCVEVTYMRLVYSSNPSISRDRNELQSTLQIAAPGESPSSSASDVDNLNHQSGASEKGALARVSGSPHVSGGHVISSRNRTVLMRVLNYAQDINCAMEASKKSRVAFTAAMSRLSETSNEKSVSSLRKVLDYTFHDIDNLLRLVRQAMEALSR